MLAQSLRKSGLPVLLSSLEKKLNVAETTWKSNKYYSLMLTLKLWSSLGDLHNLSPLYRVFTITSLIMIK